MRSNKQIAALMQTALVTAALTASMMTAAPMFGQTSQVDNPDWPLRSSEIHWPTGHTPADADLFAHNELLIHSSCSNVWQHLVQAQTWPEWYSNSRNVRRCSSGIACK
jgi:hypothetical protein